MALAARHTRRGNYRAHWVATIADTSAPTVAEINAGTDLSGNVAFVNDFVIERSLIELGTVDAYGLVLSAAGPPIVPAPPTLIFYDEGTATSALRTTLAAGTKGHVVFTLDGAPVATERAAVWPVISQGPADNLIGELEAAQFSVSFAVWDMPDEEAVIAA